MYHCELASQLTDRSKIKSCDDSNALYQSFSFAIVVIKMPQKKLHYHKIMVAAMLQQPGLRLLVIWTPANGDFNASRVIHYYYILGHLITDPTPDTYKL